MTEEKQKKGKETEYDIFIANAVFPEAKAVFTAKIKPLADLKDEAIIILDTNALLVPYGTGKESLGQIQRTYKSLVASQRLLIPGQVAREFAKNRANRISELFQQLNRKKNVAGLQKGKYPLLESLEAYQEVTTLEKEIDDKLRDYKKAIDRVLDHIRSWAWDDPVSLLYANLFDDVVLDPTVNKEEIRVDLLRRQTHQIPPGYKDSGKEDKGIGDLLIWYTILEIGKSRKKDVIFVSSDQKADWWYRSEGQPLYPRYELVEEFRRCSDGLSFHIVEFSQFLDLYGASESVVKEIREQELKQQVEDLASVGEFKRMKVVFRDWVNSPNPIAGEGALDIPESKSISQYIGALVAFTVTTWYADLPLGPSGEGVVAKIGSTEYYEFKIVEIGEDRKTGRLRLLSRAET